MTINEIIIHAHELQDGDQLQWGPDNWRAIVLMPRNGRTHIRYGFPPDKDAIGWVAAPWELFKVRRQSDPLA